MITSSLWLTYKITFLPAFNQGGCEVKEGGNFDRDIGWSETCDFMCMRPCGSTIDPQCNALSRCEGTAGDETFATCNTEIGTQTSTCISQFIIHVKGANETRVRL